MTDEQQGSGATAVILGLTAIALLGVLDYTSHARIAFEAIYLVPVSLVVWSSGKKFGILLSAAAAAAGTVAELAVDPSRALAPLPYWNGVLNLSVFLVVISLLPALKREREAEMSRTDYLTGAANKKRFMDLLENEIQRTLRYRHPFTVAYLDIDNLKFLNQRFGHNIGDTMLQTVAQTIRKKIRVVDMVARVGDDEFAILFPETQPEPAQIVVRRIHQSLCDATQQNEWPVTFSMGVATFVQPPASTSDLFRKLDHLLFAAKNSGKNMVKHEIVTAEIPAPKNA